MKERLFIKDFPPFLKLIFDLIITFVVFVVFFFGILFIYLKIKGLTFSLNMLSDYSNMDRFMFLQALNTFSIFLLPSLFIAFFYTNNISAYLGFRQKAKISSYLLVFGLVLLIQPLVSILVYFSVNTHLPGFAEEIREKFLQKAEQFQFIIEKMLTVSSTKDLIRNLIVIGLLPAIGEEFFFRGILQKRMIEITKSPDFGILITALVFSFIHFEFSGFLARFFMGIMLGYLYFWSKTIWLSVFAHFLNNSFMVLLYWLSVKNSWDINALQDVNITTQTLIFGLINLILIGIFLSLIKKWEYGNSENTQNN